MYRHHPDLDRRMRLILAVAVASIIIGGTVDLVLDQPDQWISFHTIFETLMLAGALVMATTLWLGWWNSARSAVALSESLDGEHAARVEKEARARAAMEGITEAIAAKLDGWRLTPAEREIAWLLLEGLEHKEIAGRTGRSERTVRQHASVIYDKSALGGRAELAAYFLRDLMLPAEEREGLQRAPAGVGTGAAAIAGGDDGSGDGA